MKCEQCASDMPGSRVICPACGFNNAMHRVDQWKAQRQTPKTETPDPAAKPVSPVAAKVRARYASEANLIQFPLTPRAETVAEKTSAPEPAWRAEMKTRVRQHLERRKTEEDGTPADPVIPTTPSEEITSQLIVESALKRIRRTQAPAPPVTPRQPLRSGNHALAHAYEPEEQLAPAPPQAEALTDLSVQPEENLLPPQPAAPTFRTYANSSPRQVVKLPKRQTLQEEDRWEEPRLERIEVAPTAASVAEVIDETEWSEPASRPVETAPVMLKETPRTTTHVVPLTATETAVPEPRKTNVWLGKPAPLWLRVLSGAVDLEAAALAYLPFFGLYTSLDGPPGWADIYLMVASLAVVVYLYLLITYSFNGRTFGMALCGLRCVDVADASTPIQFKRRLWQALGGTVALLCPPFNYVVTRVTSYQRGFADALGQTITLRRAQD